MNSTDCLNKRKTIEETFRKVFREVLSRKVNDEDFDNIFQAWLENNEGMEFEEFFKEKKRIIK